MATINIRRIDDETMRLLKRLAARNNRSVEAEARQILTESTREPGLDTPEARARVRKMWQRFFAKNPAAAAQYRRWCADGAAARKG